MLNRRGFILGAIAAPAVIRTPGLIMPVKPVIETPKLIIEDFEWRTIVPRCSVEIYDDVREINALIRTLRRRKAEAEIGSWFHDRLLSD